MVKSIGDNYKIYGLIIVKIIKKLLVLNYGLSSATFETPNHVFALSIRFTPKHYGSCVSFMCFTFKKKITQFS
jgi:hypothetical protein